MKSYLFKSTIKVTISTVSFKYSYRSRNNEKRNVRNVEGL